MSVRRDRVWSSVVRGLLVLLGLVQSVVQITLVASAEFERVVRKQVVDLRAVWFLMLMLIKYFRSSLLMLMILLMVGLLRRGVVLKLLVVI
jgi:hypothetical protein